MKIYFWVWGAFGQIFREFVGVFEGNETLQGEMGVGNVYELWGN